MLKFAIALVLFPWITEGQTLSFLKALPGPNNQGSIMRVDASGVYSFGDTIRKYGLDGTAIWSREHPRAQTVAWLTGAAAGIYATGHVTAAPLTGRIQAFVSLYDVQGNELWNRPIQFADAGTYSRSIAADESGVYVSVATNALAELGSYYLRKYDPRGAELWTKRLDGPVSGVAVDASGIYARTARDLRKYDRNGTEVWVRPIEDTTQPYDIKANATGVYLTGHEHLKGYFLARYDANGNQVWIRYGQSGWIALDANSVYVTAMTFQEAGQCAAGSADTLVIRYDLDGKVLWKRQFGTYANEYPQAIAAGPDGVLIAGFGSGETFLAKLDPAATTTTGPHILNECVVNAASYMGGAVSPGEIVTIFGSGIGPGQLVAARNDRPLETVLAETRILFDGIPAPLLYTSAGQVGAAVPNAVAAKTSVGIQVDYRGVLSNAVVLPVLKTHPGIFGADGAPVVWNEDGTLNSRANPAPRSGIISMFITGGGSTSPPTADGAIAGNPPPKLIAPVRAYFSTATDTEFPELVEAEVVYAGAVTGFVGGLAQINVRLPEEIAGTMPLALTFGEEAKGLSQTVWISVAEK